MIDFSRKKYFRHRPCYHSNCFSWKRNYKKRKGGDREETKVHHPVLTGRRKHRQICTKSDSRPETRQQNQIGKDRCSMKPRQWCHVVGKKHNLYLQKKKQRSDSHSNDGYRPHDENACVQSMRATRSQKLNKDKAIQPKQHFSTVGRNGSGYDQSIV